MHGFEPIAKKEAKYSTKHNRFEWRFLKICNYAQFVIFHSSGLSNYDKLNKEEQELCSLIRVVPDSFLTYKKLLITENNKLGYLRLADARKLIKIDVNKTRVMYDFFFEHGYINKPLQ